MYHIYRRYAAVSSLSAAKSFDLGVSRDSLLTVISRANGPRVVKVGLPNANREPNFDRIHITGTANVIVDGRSDSYTVIQLPVDCDTGENSTQIEVPPDCNVLVKDESHNGELHVHVSQLENARIGVQNERGRTTFSKIKTTRLACASEWVAFVGNCSAKECALRNDAITLRAKLLQVDELQVRCGRLDAQLEALYARSAKFLYENGSIASRFSHGAFDIEKVGGEHGTIRLGCLNGDADVRVASGSCDLHAFAFQFERFSAALHDGLLHVDVARHDLDEYFEFSPSTVAPNDKDSDSNPNRSDRLEVLLCASRVEVAQSIRFRADHRDAASDADADAKTKDDEYSVVPGRLAGYVVSSRAQAKNVRRNVKAQVQSGTVRLGVSSWPDWLLRTSREQQDTAQ